MTMTVKGRTHKGTWLGRRGESYELQATNDRNGLRVYVMHWIEPAHEKNGGHPAGTTVLRLITGSSRDDTFEEYRKIVLPPEKADEAADLAARLLASAMSER